VTKAEGLEARFRAPFIDSDGNAYLYVSTDRIIKRWSRRLKPTISVIPLTGDLLHAAGPRTALFSGASGTWEAAGAAVPTVEGPAMARHNGTYYLMYSGGGWRGSYGMGYAISSSPVSGFVKQPRRLLVETSAVLGPGGGDGRGFACTAVRKSPRAGTDISRVV